MNGKEASWELKTKLKVAIDNSLALGNFDNENPKKAMCEMELLFQADELHPETQCRRRGKKAFHGSLDLFFRDAP